MAAYATRDDFLALGLAAKATANVGVQDVEAALEAASRTVDSYIGSRFDLPLKTWDAAVTQAVVSIATYRVLGRRGFAAGAADAEQVRLAYGDAISWCKDVAKGLALPAPPTTTDQSKPPVDAQAQPYVRSQAYLDDGSGVSQPPTRRGW